MGFTRDELRALAILEGLPDEHLDWFCAHGERVVLDTGQHMFERGAVAAEPSEVLRLDASRFREMLDVSMEVARRLVAQMSDRVRGDVRLEQQTERMFALGRLSAGLAHELNNPAAAMRRAASRLCEHRAKLPALVTALVRHHVGEEGLAQLQQLRHKARTGTPASTPLERSEREEELLDWLGSYPTAEPWETAATLTEAGLSVEDLAALAVHVPAAVLPDALAWLGAGIDSDLIVDEISSAAERISDLVASIKTYSYMDRSPEHKPTDVRTGLDNTIVMLGHKLEQHAIRLVRDYQADLPRIPGNAGQLNQVWTNLIGNAVDAMDRSGELTLRARLSDAWVEVEVADDGRGIADEIRAHIFELFFTTKDVGGGTGLGPGIAKRIVDTHQGHIEVRSKRGETVMCVRLPVERRFSSPDPAG